MPEISDEQRDATLAALRAMNDELADEAQMKRDAERWQWLNRRASDRQWQIVRLFDDCAEADAYIDAQIAKEQ